MTGLCIQPHAPSESSTLPSLSPTRNQQPTPQPTTRRNQNAELDREVCLKLFAHYKNSKLILIRYFVTTMEHAWIQKKGLFNLLPYLITPPPPYKNVHDRFIHFRKNTFFIIWYNIPIYTIPKTHYPLGRGRGVVGVNVKGRTLSFRSYLLNINHLFNLHHQ